MLRLQGQNRISPTTAARATAAQEKTEGAADDAVPEVLGAMAGDAVSVQLRQDGQYEPVNLKHAMRDKTGKRYRKKSGQAMESQIVV